MITCKKPKRLIVSSHRKQSLKNAECLAVVLLTGKEKRQDRDLLTAKPVHANWPCSLLHGSHQSLQAYAEWMK